MNITEQEVLNLLSTQRLTNDNYLLRDMVQQLNATLQTAQEKIKALVQKSGAETVVTLDDIAE